MLYTAKTKINYKNVTFSVFVFILNMRSKKQQQQQKNQTKNKKKTELISSQYIISNILIRVQVRTKTLVVLKYTKKKTFGWWVCFNTCHHSTRKDQQNQKGKYKIKMLADRIRLYFIPHRQPLSRSGAYSRSEIFVINNIACMEI